MVVEENAAFLLVDVERRAADVARLERVDQRVRLDQRPAAGIDDERTPASAAPASSH